VADVFAARPVPVERSPALGRPNPLGASLAAPAELFPACDRVLGARQAAATLYLQVYHLYFPSIFQILFRFELKMIAKMIVNYE
jgi:hypothetical protein